jgi:hypothetical protein
MTTSSLQNFFHIQTVHTLADTNDDTAAVTITEYHCYYIIIFRETSKADYNVLNGTCL